MKKLFFLSILLKLSLTSCQETKHDKSIINSFIQEMVLNEDACLNYSEFSSYLEINQDIVIDAEKKKNMIGLIQQHIVGLKMTLYENEDFQLVRNSDLEDLELKLNFAHTDYAKVYHLVSNNEILTTFVMGDSKIISFFYTFRKKESQPLRPWLLN
ncbi:hypothetical protein J0X14_09410 [Muricauda sp. CAU 1633]|uniref:hypothetical protein n=1 Tax=Allomuricauda sp. CAU 1633 TaxID=2816036 RepID=UPI001A8C1683|nr:hypothetical protein [Muricauda sp. CAU 1633]MBO0322515.1 hypothetical protein [Muricauda sp. CAU 1633]